MFSISSVLVDTNVWLSYFCGDDANNSLTCDALLACSDRGISLLYAPTSIKDLFYIIPRRLRSARHDSDSTSGDKHDNASFLPAAWACVKTMTEIATAARTAEPECQLARMLRSKHPDFEDNLIIATADASDVDYVLTYDQKLIEHFRPACLTPRELLDALNSFPLGASKQ